jgi:hypothetical protein
MAVVPSTMTCFYVRRVSPALLPTYSYLLSLHQCRVVLLQYYRVLPDIPVVAAGLLVKSDPRHFVK